MQAQSMLEILDTKEFKVAPKAISVKDQEPQQAQDPIIIESTEKIQASPRQIQSIQQDLLRTKTKLEKEK